MSLNVRLSILEPRGTSAWTVGIANAATATEITHCRRVVMAIMVPRRRVGVNRPVSAIGRVSRNLRHDTGGSGVSIRADLKGADNLLMRRIVVVIALFLFAPAASRAGCDLFDRLWFSAASPGYPASEFWTPRLYRLHACHEPVSVSSYPPGRCDAIPGYVPVGPYCPGSQPHFPYYAPSKP